MPLNKNEVRELALAIARDRFESNFTSSDRITSEGGINFAKEILHEISKTCSDLHESTKNQKKPNNKKTKIKPTQLVN